MFLRQKKERCYLCSQNSKSFDHGSPYTNQLPAALKAIDNDLILVRKLNKKFVWKNVPRDIEALAVVWPPDYFCQYFTVIYAQMRILKPFFSETFTHELLLSEFWQTTKINNLTLYLIILLCYDLDPNLNFILVDML